MEKQEFKAESKRLLDLMINSIYTNKEIFLREIISNSSDAIDKLCYVALTDDKLNMQRDDFKIEIAINEELREITISDNGIGMTYEELEENLGTIAKSGSGAFKAGLDSDKKDAAAIDIIGQFGVGFYSAFMVADKVTVTSRAYNSDKAYTWESEGEDGYTIIEAEKADIGTEIVIHIKADEEDETYSEFLSVWKVRGLVKKYSDYVRYPIVMDVEKPVSKLSGELDADGAPEYETVFETFKETVNSMVPIWQRSKSEVSDEECIAFYKEKFHDFEDPRAIIRVSVEGNISYKALLFVPAKPSMNFVNPKDEAGPQLYSSGVMIMDRCPELINDCFMFVRGVVDSQDLSLNISREMLQHDRQLKTIATNLNKKIKSELLKMMNNEREKYEDFYNIFGTQIRFGAVSGYGENLELVKDLLLFNVTADKKLTINEYKENMSETQEKIYYAVGETVEKTLRLPQAELLREKGYDLLCLSEEMDEFIIERMALEEEFELCNIARDELGLSSEEEKAELTKKSEENKEILDFVNECLAGAVESVGFSDKLVSAPVCLSTTGEISLEMEKYFKKMEAISGMPAPKAMRVLELNAEHSAFSALKLAYESDREKAAILSEILHFQALIIAGESLENPTRYAELVCGLF